MKKYLLGALGIAALFTVSCKKDLIENDVQKPFIPGVSVDTLVGNISSNVTLTRTTYLKGIVLVDSLVTLTVNPGVTIIGSAGGIVPDLVNFENNKGTLIVRRGARLIANGTASQPIVWTSAQPAGSRNFGDWGGVVILGKATTVTATGGAEGLYEAFRLASNPVPFTYGSATPDDNDNSGSMRYNRIEFAGGVVLEANREVNGLTLCGVGRNTVLDFIEVSNSGDDAFEFFGGRVNAKHLLAWNTKDDDYDFDEGYVGNLQFIIAFRGDLADNSGETVFDRILIEEIARRGVTVTYAVKERPIINDALAQDAAACGIDRIARVISSGSDAPGTVLSLCSRGFLRELSDADMVISKGQGNFEALSSSAQRPVFFLFMAKCPVVARDVDCAIGDIILLRKKGKTV